MDRLRGRCYRRGGIHPFVWAALGLLLWQRGRAAEARPYLDLFVASAPPARYAPAIDRVRGLLLSRRPQG